MFHTPVALIVFNRPATTRRVFDAVAKIRPKKLLIVGDGPREAHPADSELCAQVRAIFERVDWPCELLRNYSEPNLGCQERVVSGLDWVFSLVDEAVILEDDCLPDLSFFPFCEALLELYRGDSRVAAVSGTNFLAQHFSSDDSYYFSRLGGIWGWATWKSEWKRYDRYLKRWPENRSEDSLREIFSDSRAAVHWSRVFDAMYATEGMDIWGYQWLYTHLVNNSVTVVPCVNLVQNIGFSTDATHTRSIDARLVVPVQPMTFPLKHPQRMVPLRSMDQKLQKLYSQPISVKIDRKVRRLLGTIFPSK